MKRIARNLAMAAMVALFACTLCACGGQSQTSTSGSSSAGSTASGTASAASSATATSASASSGASTASGSSTSAATASASSAASAAEVDAAGGESGNVLVAYFSATGNTAGVAELIAQETGADLFEIVPTEPYTSDDLDYNDANSRTSLENSDPSIRPEISSVVDNWDSYDTVFVGYPIWWGSAPAIMQTFVESYDWDGKTVVAFCTSASSDFGSSDSALKSAASGATWLEGQRFSQSATAADVQEWIDGLGL